MTAVILLMGKNASDNIKRLKAQCLAQEKSYAVFDTQKFGTQDKLFTRQDELHIKIDQQIWATKDLTGIFWDSIAMPPPSNDISAKFQDQNATNIASWLQVFFNQSQLNWVNSWQAFQFHKTKPIQLKLAQKLGASIPPSFFGNEIQGAREFLSDYPNAIVKPIHGGEYTQVIDEAVLESLPHIIKQRPVAIQQKIDGMNIRTYVVGNTLFSAQIHSDELDYRSSGNIKIVPLKVPTKIEQLSVRITRAFHMQWSAIDWLRKPNGEYVFLEANPSPQFSEFEKQTTYPISRYLMTLLKG